MTGSDARGDGGAVFALPDRCPRCGGRTYTWGNPLPGQTPLISPIAMAQIDQRERDNRTCIECQHTWSQT